MSSKVTPEVRRQMILDAAVRVFAQHGFDAATTDDIARAAQLSKGGLYWHFKSKDDILAALLMQFFDQELGFLQQLLATEGAVAPRVRRFVEQSTHDMQQFEQSLPVILAFYALAARRADVQAFLQRYYQRYHQLLTSLFEQGYASGELRSGNAQTAATALLAQLEGLVLLWAITPQLAPIRQQASATTEVLLRGLGAP